MGKSGKKFLVMRKYLIVILSLLIYLPVCSQFRQVGDVIANKDGSKGVVFWVNPDGSGGWMVALKDLPARHSWMDRVGDVPGIHNAGADAAINEFSKVFEALADTAGRANTAAMREFARGDGAAEAVDFPHGWYLPSAGQMRKLYAAMPFIGDILRDNGGAPLQYESYWTSTEYDAASAWTVFCHPGEVAALSKDTLLYIRPVRSFSLLSFQHDTTLAYQWNTGDTDPVIGLVPARTTEYTVTATTKAGCANQAACRVFVAGGEDILIRDAICPGEVYDKNGFHVSVPGTHTRIMENADGCEVTVTLILEQNPHSETVFSDTIVEGEIYIGHNFAEWKEGRHRQVWSNRWGCDSVVILDLRVCHPSDTVYIDSVCPGSPYSGHGFDLPTVVKDTVCTHFYRNALGCDSIVSVDIRLRQTSLTPMEEDICDGDTYHFAGMELKDSGVYQDTLARVNGCDSIVQLTLKVRPEYYFSSSQVICEGTSYYFAGQQLAETGVYYDSLTTTYGCDSIRQLDLKVGTVYNRHIEDSICPGEQYSGNGFQVSDTGVYVRALQTVLGCDSIISLHLNRLAVFEGDIRIDLGDCRNHSYGFALDCVNPGELGEYSCEWTLGNLFYTAEKTFEYVVADSGRYEVTVRVRTPDNCESVLKRELAVPYYSEDVLITADRTTIGESGAEVAFQTPKIPGMLYAWDFGDGDTAEGDRVSHVYGIEGDEYYDVLLTVSNAEDCTVEKQIQIRVYPPLKVPNTISPNGDGINDVFMRGYRLRIADRNGVEIFKGDDGWDGTRNGRRVPDDTYFYELFYTSELGEQVKTGYIMVVHQ